MVQGTGSDAGKSVLVTALCRIFSAQGKRTAPFKSQNMSNNSYITLDGKEIGRAQGVQAEAAGILATTDMNPILLKPSGESEAQVIVNGKPYQQFAASSYRRDFFHVGYQVIQEAYERLASSYERIVIEGAGSPAEINLNDRELVNMRVARMTHAPVILVADIDKGGVFAQLVGTLQLLEPVDRERVIGVVINKFRGDVSLLQSGLDWFEEYSGKPVLGVLPYMPNLQIEAEDSVILDRYESQSLSPDLAAEMDERNPSHKKLDIAVIRYPLISNFTDVDALRVEADCHVRFVQKEQDLGQPDLIVLPGSKNTLADLLFLQESGLADRIKSLHISDQSMVVGICGGYQMLGQWVRDPHQVESTHDEVQGLGIIPIVTYMSAKKTTVRSTGTLHFNQQKWEIDGYEIHMGQSTFKGDDTSIEKEEGTRDSCRKWEPLIKLSDQQDGWRTKDGRVLGTYFHGLFDHDPLRKHILNHLRQLKGWSAIEQRVSYDALKEQSFCDVADMVREHLRLDVIEEQMRYFANRG